MGQKAILMFDPDRRPEQVAFVTARTQILHQNGDQAWVVVEEGQAERMAAEGMAILVAEQRAGLVLRVAHRGLVLSRGRFVRSGMASELAADPALADLMAGG